MDTEKEAELYESAKKLVISTQQCSGSFIARELNISIKKAGALIDKMEGDKIVGAFMGNKAREVLIKEYIPTVKAEVIEGTGTVRPQTPENPAGGGTHVAVDPDKSIATRGDVITRKENFDYEHYFTTEERADMSDVLSTLYIEASELESKKKAVTADYSSQIEAKKAEAQRISNLIRSKFEMRATTGIIVKDFNTNEKHFYLKDGDLAPIKTVKMTSADYTIEFPDNMK